MNQTRDTLLQFARVCENLEIHLDGFAKALGLAERDEKVPVSVRFPRARKNREMIVDGAGVLLVPEKGLYATTAELWDGLVALMNRR